MKLNFMKQKAHTENNSNNNRKTKIKIIFCWPAPGCGVYPGL